MGVKKTTYKSGYKNRSKQRNKKYSKKPKTNSYRCAGCNQPGICTKYMMTKDKPSKISNLEFRCGFTIISWLVMVFTVSKGTSIFASLVMFAIPLFVDYINFIPEGKNILARKWIKKIGLALAFLWITIGFIGLMGIFEIIQCEGIYYIHTSQQFIFMPNYSFKYIYIILPTLLSPLMTYIDRYAFQTDYEHIVYKRYNQIGKLMNRDGIS